MNSEQNSTKIMNEEDQVQSALDSIAVIRQMIDRTEVNMRRLGALFLAYGIINLAQTLLKALFSTFYLNSDMNYTDSIIQKANVNRIVTVGTSFLTWAVLLTIFILMRRRMRKTESRYTMKLFDMWGIMMFLPSILEGAYALTHLIPSVSAESYMIGAAAFNIIRSGAVCMCLFFTGHYTDNRVVKTVSLVLLMLIPISCAVDMSWLGTTDISTVAHLSAVDVYQYLMIRAGCIDCILMVIYIIIGVIFLVKREGKANGAQQYS